MFHYLGGGAGNEWTLGRSTSDFDDYELIPEYWRNIKAVDLSTNVPVAGGRERDALTGLTMPPHFTISSLLIFVAHPKWFLNLLRHPDFQLANVAHRQDSLRDGTMGVIRYINSQIDGTIG